MSSKLTRYGIASPIYYPITETRGRPLANQRPTARSLPYLQAEGVDMKSNHFKNIAGTAVMAFSLILGISSITAAQSQDPYQNDRYRRQQDEQYRRQQAEQYRRDQEDRWRRDQNDQWNRGRNQDQWGRDRWGRGRGDGYPNWGGNYELRQTALNAGYNAGAKEGRNDRNRRRGYGYGYTDFGRFSSYRDASKDYNSRFGNRELYRRYFQMAFENGYADGLRGY